MDQVKRLMRMQKPELLELLQEITEENDRLRGNCRQLEEANAKLALSNHELNMECDALHEELTALRREPEIFPQDDQAPFTATEAAYGQPRMEAVALEESVEEAHSLPAGSFAEAMVAVEQIVARTQAAADAYLERCRHEAEERSAQAEALLAQAQRRADEMLEQARAQKAALERETREASDRLRDEMQRLNQFMSTMDPVEKTEGTP